MRMLGGCSVSYDGKTYRWGGGEHIEIYADAAAYLAWRKDGILKELLIDALNGWSVGMVGLFFGVLDWMFFLMGVGTYNGVNNLLQQIRRHLQSAGLPESSNITLTEGVYRGDSQLPVRTDVMEFEELVVHGLETVDKAESEMCLCQAFDLYQGELLPAISTEIWNIEKQLHLRQIFTDFVERLENYCRERQDM